jgi:hypothetical protein
MVNSSCDKNIFTRIWIAFATFSPFEQLDIKAILPKTSFDLKVHRPFSGIVMPLDNGRLQGPKDESEVRNISHNRNFADSL